MSTFFRHDTQRLNEYLKIGRTYPWETWSRRGIWHLTWEYNSSNSPKIGTSYGTISTESIYWIQYDRLSTR